MTEPELASWLWWLALAAAATLAGVVFARRMPWAEAAWQARIPTAFGLALAPFLVGLVGVLVLGVLPGAPTGVHKWVVLALLLALAVAAWRLPRPPIPRLPFYPQEGTGGMAWVLGSGLLGGWVMYLLVEALLLPLVANDALEYATVGRLLFETRSLLDYPAIHPERGSSGFFAPWTHPPLYTASIYLAYAAQGHADMPGLMRLIAPWYFLTGAWLLRSMGNTVSRMAGLMAGLAFVSTPLAVSGAGTSLIDALPMNGLALVIATLALLQGPATRLAVLRGLALGLALWTHSQAILLLPLALAALVLVEGWSPVRQRAKALAVVAGVACLVAAWPYGRNVLLFGSLVSDNPVVFAMPQLAWDEYFAKARGLEGWPERIQYGIFKGWFALESFGFTFWFMAVGLWLLWPRVPLRSWPAALAAGVQGAQARMWTAAAAIVLGYLGGVVLSTLLGLDLMIKNDRYLLAVLPAAAMVAGLGLARWFGSVAWIDATANRWRDHARAFVVMVLAAGLAMQWAAAALYQHYKRGTLDVKLARILDDSQEDKLQHWPGYRVARFMTERLPADALILSERPAEMYYAGRRMMSFLDPRLVPAYLERDPVAAVARLRTLGITHLQLPGYSHPAIYNTTVQAIAARPDLSTLVFSAGTEQVYALRPSGGRLGTPEEIGPGATNWVQVQRYSLLGVGIDLGDNAFTGQERSVSGFRVPVLQRGILSMVLSGTNRPHTLDQDLQGLVPVEPGREYLVEVDLEGDAYAYVYLFQYERLGRYLGRGRPSSELIADVPLAPGSGPRKVTRRIATAPKSGYIRIGVEHRGNTWLRLLGVRLAPIEPGSAPGPAQGRPAT